jgi:hypothetical protein
MKADEESRIRLYPLPPIGQGSSVVEGLDSYLIRLAGEHCVSPRDLIRRVLLPANPMLQGTMTNTFCTKESATIGGLGLNAERFIVALELLSSRRDLSQLTLLPLRNLFPANGEGLLAHTKRWCPICLKEFALKQQPTYRPLLWSLKLYVVCHRHGVSLQDRCPQCNGKQAFIPRWPVIDRCDQCGGDLAAAISVAVAGTAGVGDLETADQVADLIGAMRYEISAGEFRSKVTQLVAAVADGNRTKFCRLLGLPKYTLKNWFAKQERPSMPQFLRLCRALELQPGTFFGMTDMTHEPTERTDARRLLHRARRQPRIAANQDLKQELENLLRCDPAPSLTRAAAALGLTVSALKYRWPIQTKLLRVRHQNYLIERKHERLQLVRAAVSDGIAQLASEGRYPSRRQLERRLRVKGLSLWQPDVRSWYVIIRDKG